MRLIRLTSSSNGEFSNNFNEDIVIQPNSKIGLKSASLSLNDTEINIKGNNREVQVQFIDGENPTTLKLDEKIYNSENDDELLDNLELNLNSAMGASSVVTSGSVLVDNKKIGIEWRVQKTQTGKTSISYLSNPTTQPLAITNSTAINDLTIKSDDITFDNDDGVDGNNLIWSAQGTATASGKNFFIGRRRLAKGLGHFRTQLHRLSDLATQGGDATKAGFSIGLTSRTPSDSMKEVEFDPRSVGLYVPAHNLEYAIVEGGHRKKLAQVIKCNDQGSPSSKPDNDIIEIERVGRTVNMYVYPSTNVGSHDVARVTLGSVVLQDEFANEDLYPFVVFHRGGGTLTDESNSDVTLMNTHWTLSGYDLAEEEFEVRSLLGTVNPHSTNTITNAGELPQYHNGSKSFSSNHIQFGSLDVANFFGFRQRRFPISGGITWSGRETDDYKRDLFVSDFAYNHSNDRTYLVVLDSIALSNYDGMQPDGTGQGQRKSILQVLMNPVGVVTERIVYQTDSPDMMDVSNRQPITLRTIKARIVDDEYNEIDTFGNDVMVLYIEDGK
mgnify:CR=1 FL=1